MHVAIIGSGVAGYSCIKTLLGRGVKITLIDTGEQLSENRQQAVNRMKEKPPSAWAPEDIQLIRKNHTLKTQRIPKKLHYGDDYLYAQNRSFSPTTSHSFPVLRSFAEGGFSTVWGGAVLPYRDDDLNEWPIRYKDLEPYYQKVLSWLPLSAREDALAEKFPIIKTNPTFIAPRGQEKLLHKDLTIAKDRLIQQGIWAGAARLTVHSQQSEDSPGCDQCGFCLTGCPRQAIWSSTPEIKRLIASNRVSHITKTFVERIRETSKGITLDLFNIRNETSHQLQFDYVFLGAGPINSARILMESLNIIDKDVMLKESSKFIIPWFRFQSTPDFHNTTVKELASAFILMQENGKSGNWIDLQISPANYLLRTRLGYEALPAALKHLSAPLFSRFMLCYGSLHSDSSPSIKIRLLPQQNNARHVLQATTDENPNRAALNRYVAKTLRSNALLFRAFPIPFPALETAPGNSFHTGGGFPMRSTPSAETDTDFLGRPKGFKRLHIIDATTFPSIPATTIGLSVMANACRIASQAPLGHSPTPTELRE